MRGGNDLDVLFLEKLRLMKLRIQILIVILLMTTCSFGQKASFTVNNVDTPTIIRLTLSKLTRNIDNYNMKWVEIKGTILYLDELFAVFPFDSSHQTVPLCLSLNEKMKVNISFLSGKQWVIRGKVNTHKKGHRSQYKGTIEQIYFLKEI